MKIVFDGRVLQFEKSGIYRNLLNLIQLIKNTHETHVLLSNAARIPDGLINDSYLHLHTFPPKASSLSLFWENGPVVRFLSRQGPAVYHTPWVFGIPIIKIKGIRYVMTINDLIPKHFPDSYPFRTRLRWHTGVFIGLKRADNILTLSDYSKKDIQEILNVAPGRIQSVPLCVNDTFFETHALHARPHSLLKQYGLFGRYIIYHGGFRPYKNVRKIIDTFTEYRKRHEDDLKLCLIGKQDDNFKAFVEPALSQSPFRSDIIAPGYLDDSELAVLLRHAKCFIYLSRIEGFCFPVLEAQASGVPVLCARTSCLPEILGDSVLWVSDTDTPQTISDRLKELMVSSDVRINLIQKGREQAARFRKELYKARMLDFYKSLRS